MKQIPPLGPVKTLSLLSTCPLCRLIFNITYLTEDDIRSITKPRVASDGQLALLPAWTIHRLEPDVDWEDYQSGDGPYAKCIYTSVTSKEAEKRTMLVNSVADAIGLVDGGGEGGTHRGPALGVREVDPRTPNYSIIKEWLHRCDAIHSITCGPHISEDLQKIKLVDVETRMITMYPPEGCDYIALSYVWGGVEQASYKLGDVLPPVPATLEDAMLVTRYLGKRYLWADSLCIEQGNTSDKAAQIPLMSAIYTGAWATIFNLAGQSAHSGLPRVGTWKGVIPQISCIVGGKQLLSVMPTLSQQISRSVWATRAWTFQEGLLSPRRLFFTHHQIYFECNSVQCCESLDDSKSLFHTPSDKQRKALLDESACTIRDAFRIRTQECVLGRGVLRNPLRPFEVADAFSPDATLEKYLGLVHAYTDKKMTQESDSLNAFSAVLVQLTDTDYRQGFLYGLPIEELPRALLWVHGTQLRRRIEFPTWSWAGWEGAVRAIIVEGAKGNPIFKKRINPPLRIWKAGKDGHPELVYGFNLATVESDSSTVDESHEGGEDEKGDERDGGVDEEENDDDDDERNGDDEDSSGGDGGSNEARSVSNADNDSEDDENAWETESSADYSEVTADSDTGPCRVLRFKLKLPSSLSEVLAKYSQDESQTQKPDREDPVQLLAQAMPAEPSVTEYHIRPDELLIEGIILKLTFRKDRQTWRDLPPYDQEDTPDGIYSERCLVQLGDGTQPQHLRIYGPDATRLIQAQSGTEHEFLLLSRDGESYEKDMWYAMLLIDMEGDTARRVGVASLKLEDDDGHDYKYELLAHAKLERRLFKLK